MGFVWGTLPIVLLGLSLTVIMGVPLTQNNAIKPIVIPNAYRLPRDIVPETYNVHLRANLDIFVFHGTVSIKVKVNTATNNITLHANELDIIEATVNEDDTTPINIVALTVNKQRHFVKLELEKELDITKSYVIEMKFNGVHADDMYGFYRSSYIKDNNTRWIVATQFQATHARRAFPCFDEPNFKATFNVTIDAPPGYECLGNMKLATDNPEPLAGGYNRYIFKETPKMSSYLIAFVVSDFAVKGNDKDFHTWARETAINDTQADYGQDLGPKLLEKLENFTAIPFELEKTDQVAITDFAAGAMENWGLITYRETALLYHDNKSTAAAKQRTALVVAHELVHMWFGNLVTLDWWSYTWLNEGFARYLQYFITNQVETDWRLMDQFVVVEHQGVFGTDARLSAIPLTNPNCNTPAEVMAMFTTISYSKGGSILRMLSHILTETTFQNGLQQYLAAANHSNVKPIDLINALTDQANTDKVLADNIKLEDVVISWTEQPGYPVITVSRSYDNTKAAKITQERFLLKGSDVNKPTWFVPLTWTKKPDGAQGFENTKPTDWLTNAQEKLITNIAENGDWVIFNNQEAGYYRINYDQKNWELIAEHLKSDKRSEIHVLNRAQLVDDALNLARANKLSYSLALDVVQYLAEETDYAPLTAFTNALAFLERRLDGSDAYDNFKTFVRKLLQKAYSGIDLDTNDQQTHIRKLTHNNLLTWICNLGDESCINEATSRFNRFLEDETKNPIAPDIQSVVYCQGLKNGDSNGWNKLWDLYLKSNVATEQAVLLTALGCTSDTALLNKFLTMSITHDSGIRKQDAASVFSAVYSNPEAIPIAFQFLKENFNSINSFYGGMNAVGNVLTGIASRLSTESQVEELKTFVTENEGQLGSAATAGKTAVETATENLDWTKTFGAEIADWLNKNSGGNSAISLTSMSVTFVIVSAAVAYLW